MIDEEIRAIYWDASVVLSILFQDAYSEEAQRWARQKGVHLISTLAYAEVYAVIHRIRRERVLADVLVRAACEALKEGPWRHLNMLPTWQSIRSLSSRCLLKGADLWHLSTVKTLHKQIPELMLLTFDNKLRVAAEMVKLKVIPKS